MLLESLPSDHPSATGSYQYDDTSPNFVTPIYNTAEIEHGFVPLGYNKGVFYYYSKSSRQVFELTSNQHTKNNLMAIASTSYFWERTAFLIDGKLQWDKITNHLMEMCVEVGIYNPDRIRGRGAWIDNNRSILHVGDQLIVSGKSQPISLQNSKHIYEAAPPLCDVVSKSLKTTEANKLVKICQLLRWERSVDGLLLAGFLAIAPVCGGLCWRPSIWLTGAAGGGKTWTLENVIIPALGRIALHVQSVTTEAGIRQALGSDARPVIFDEAECEDKYAARRMQSILSLVRQSASEGGAEIVKGTQTQHSPMRFRIRSCFLFSSINVGLQHQADESRVTVLSLRSPKTGDADPATFDDLKRLAAEITPAFSAALLARSTELLPVIRANAEVFACAVAARLGSRRLGDQLGALLAGGYSLHKSSQISREDADDCLAKHNFNLDAPQSEDKDEQKLLNHILQSRIKIGASEISLARLLECALNESEDYTSESASKQLIQHGIRPCHGGIDVSTNHPALKSILADTPWAAKWGRTLARLPGALARDKVVRFGFGHVGSAVFIPSDTVDPH